MPGGFKPPIEPKIKQEILNRVRQGTQTIAAIARDAKVSESTIHSWQEKRVSQAPNALETENARLRRELAEVRDLFLNVSLELERSKKKGRGE